jgi:hypothetical protein
MEFASLRSGLLLVLALAAAPAAEAQDACQAVADQIRRDGVPELAHGSAMRLEEALPASFKPSPALKKALSELAVGGGNLRLQRAGQSALHAASVNEGSANCQSFVFFEMSPDGRADIVVEPPIIVNGRNGVLLFCTGFGVESALGEIAGEPAFIVEIGKNQDEEVRFTPWRDHVWQKECRIAVRYSTRFSVDEQYCQGVDCGAVSARARELAMRFDKDPDSFANLPQVDDKYVPLLSGPAELPTFGKSSPSQQNFGEESAVWSVVLGGQSYVARLGHGAIGWRKYPDYLLALYRMDGDKLEPVAGIRIAKTRGKLVDVTVK